MPYTSFTKTKGGIRVAKKGGGGFTAHTSSMQQAHKTAAMREMASRGTLRVARNRRNPGASSLGRRG